VNGRFFLTGNVSTPDASNKIANVVAAYFNQGTGAPNMDSIVNLLQVSGEQQVMLRVKIMEVSKSLLRELGIDTQLDDTSLLGNNDYLTGAIDTIAGTGLTQNPFATGSLIFDDGNFGPLSFMLSALENDQMAQTLAEPNLTAISGEQAGFLAGGEFPVPSGRDQDGNVIIEYRSFGVSLNFRPVVLSSDRISLQMNTEVSSISRDNSVTLNGLDVPGLSIRRASTTV
jgi:pilus assembly protein CpaC